MLKKSIIRKATKEEIERADVLVKKKGILRTTYKKPNELMQNAIISESEVI